MEPALQVTFDAADPPSLGGFWALALGYEPDPAPPGFATWEAWLTHVGIPEERWRDRYAISDPSGLRPRLFFQKVPEAKTAKNRVHLDVAVGGGSAVPVDERADRVEAAVSALVAAGATVLERFTPDHDYWVVLTDPEGNEFCVM